MSFVKNNTSTPNLIEEFKFQISELQYHISQYEASMKEVEYHLEKLAKIKDELLFSYERAI